MCPRDYREAITQGWHLLTHSLIAIHLPFHPTLHDHLSQFCSTPGLLIINYRGHRHLWWALIAGFSSTCIQRNQSSELLLPHLPVSIARQETPSSTSSDTQYQIRMNSICRDTHHSCLIAQGTAILPQGTQPGTHHQCSAPVLSLHRQDRVLTWVILKMHFATWISFFFFFFCHPISIWIAFFSCCKFRSQSPKAVQQCDSCTSSLNSCIPRLDSQVDGKSHPVTYMWAVGGRCWVQSLHWCCWGHVKTSLLLNLLQKEWLVCQRNNLNYSVWTQLQACCPMSSVERVRQKDRGTGNCI